MRSALLQQAVAFSAEIERLESLPKDNYEDGCILVFNKVFCDGGKVYEYAVIKSRGLWFTTGTKRQWFQLV